MRRPGIGIRGWLVVGTILLLGLGAFFYTILSGVLGGHRTVFAVDAPGVANVELRRAGDYTLYIEYSKTVDSLRVVRPRGVENLQATLLNPSGAAIPLFPAEEDRYAIRRLVGESYRDFTIPEPGEYRLVTEYPESTGGPPTRLVFKRTYRQQVVETFLRGFGTLVATGILTGGALRFLFLKSRENRDSEFKL